MTIKNASTRFAACGASNARATRKQCPTDSRDYRALGRFVVANVSQAPCRNIISSRICLVGWDDIALPHVIDCVRQTKSSYCACMGRVCILINFLCAAASKGIGNAHS